MFSRPSARRKNKSHQIELNLVPMLDTLVTLISFLLFTMSFLSIVSIESPAPIASTAEQEQTLKEKLLQLTLSIDDKESKIWSPFDKIAAKSIPHLPDGAPDTRKIHEELIAIKTQFPAENKIVLMPSQALSYDLLIATMDSARSLEPTDPPIFIKNPATGTDEALKGLFSEVIFGNLFGES